MTRALLERFIVHRPHPWGAMVTFIELLRNPKYDFWNREFVRIAPEISLLLESVSAVGTGEIARLPGLSQVKRELASS